MNGIVYLVGAGPGDPGLLTVKGKECIEKADVVVYDFLAAPTLLAHASSTAEQIYVGKKGGTTPSPRTASTTCWWKRPKLATRSPASKAGTRLFSAGAAKRQKY